MISEGSPLRHLAIAGSLREDIRVNGRATEEAQDHVNSNRLSWKVDPGK